MAMTRAGLPTVLDCGHAPRPTFYGAGNRVTVGNRQIVMTGEEVISRPREYAGRSQGVSLVRRRHAA